MTPESGDRAAEIRARLDAATPGPWELKPSGAVLGPPGHKRVLKPWVVNLVDLVRDANAEFIVNAPTDVAFLLAEVERLTRERDFLDRHCDALGAEEVRLGRQRDEARAEARAEAAVIAAVRALHAPREEWISPFTEARGLQCTHCRVADWPCPTVAVLPPAPEETQ